MLVTKVLPLAFAATAIASPANLFRRDLATIQAAFSSISTAVNSLDNGIKAITPATDPQGAVDSLTQLSGVVIGALNSGTASVTPTSNVGLADAVSLLSSSNTLVSAVNTTISDLISKKSILDAANADATIIQQLQDQKTASQAFIAAVITKVPSSVSNLANQQAQQVVTALNRGITAFGGTVTRK